MNDGNLQQLALLDTLLSNWDGILIRLGPIPPALEEELARIVQQIGTAPDAEAIARLLDRWFDLTEDTEAYAYVRELIRRAALPERSINRAAVSSTGEQPLDSSEITRAAAGFSNLPPLAKELSRIPVFFATNRVKEAGDRFGGTFSNDLSHGVTTVTIPRLHRVGQVERPGWLRSENKDRHVTIEETTLLGGTDFLERLGKTVAAAPRRELLVFLHGYRVTFEEAARRAAQIARDMNFQGEIVLFSWPSAASFQGYCVDEGSAMNSAQPLGEFMRTLEGGPWEKIHIVAHSMGNRVMASCLSSEVKLELPIRNIVLIAADLDVVTLEQQFSRIAGRVRPGRGDLITSYASKKDRALLLSWHLHRANRVGHIPDQPYVHPGMETIDATETDTNLLSLHHSYFGNERSVLTDLGTLVGEGLPAARRPGLRQVGKWWAFPR